MVTLFTKLKTHFEKNDHLESFHAAANRMGYFIIVVLTFMVS